MPKLNNILLDPQYCKWNEINVSIDPYFYGNITTLMHNKPKITHPNIWIMHITYDKIISSGDYQFKRLEELQLGTRTYTIVLPKTI
jgi:hypothetical protein